MATTKNYLDYAGLSKYDELLKAFVSNTYVAKENGKSLMTDAQATKLAGIAEGAQVNVIESISVKGNGGTVTPITPNGKGVTIDISAYALSSEVTAEANRAKGAESALGGRIDAIFTPASDGHEASGSVVTYVNKKIEDVNTAASALAGRVTANETSIATLKGDAQTQGSVAHTVATEIAKVVNGAPDSFDTLKEIADWIANDTTGAAKMANDIAILKGEETVEGSVKKALKDAKTYADGLDKATNDKLTETNNALGAEKSRAEAAEKALAGRLDIVEGTGAGSIKKALQDAKSYTDGKIGIIPAQVGETSTATVVTYVDAKVAAEQKRASDAESGLNTRLAKIETSLGDTSKSMNERVTALETTVGDSNSGLVKGVADNKTAIAAVDGKVASEKSRAEGAEAALQEAIDAFQPIKLTGENSIASLFPTAQA